MIEETWTAKKTEKKFKEDPLDLEAGFVPLPGRQDLVTWAKSLLYGANHTAVKQSWYNHSTENAVFTGFQFPESISTHNKEE